MHSQNQPHQQAQHHAYIVRFWRDHPKEAWRIVLLDVKTGELLSCVDLDDLFIYFLRKAAQPSGTVDSDMETP